MAEPPLIKALTVQNFRGFLKPATVRLDASATIITGPNGSGKTSLFDAVQWLMLGRIERLASLASKRSGDYVVSSFAPRGEPAAVSAELRVHDQHIVVRREGTAKDNSLTWMEGINTLEGQEAEKKLCDALVGDSELTLQDTMLTSGLLQQDVVRAVLENQPKDRYRHMASMLGLNEIAGFEDRAKAQSDVTRKDAARALEEYQRAESLLESAESDLERLQQRLVSQSDFQKAHAALERRLLGLSQGLVIPSLPTAVPDAVSLGQWARRIRNASSDLLLDDETLRKQETEVQPSDAPVDEVGREESQRSAELEQAREARAEAEQAWASAQERASQFAQLAAIALPLLTERCPVCEQAIDRTSVAAHLHAVAGGEEEARAHLKERLSLTSEAVSGAVEDLRKAAGRRIEIEALQRQAQIITRSRKAWRDRCSRLSQELGASASNEAAAALLRGELATLKGLTGSADLVAGVADELAALLGASGLSDEVDRQRDEVTRLRQTVAENGTSAAKASARAAGAKTLAVAATESITGVARKRFATLQPLLNDIFRRLDPHPVFRTLGFDLTVAYRSGVADPFVRDDQGITGDPLLVFSSSQANVAALTYFLAVSWAAGPQALPFLLLDDPLQSMDDVNALGFSDLCRHIRTRRQLVVSTHERRLASLLERKLLPRGTGELTRVIHFTGWDRSGPTLREDEIDAVPGASFLLSAA